MKEEKRLEDVMGSLKGIQRAKAPHDGFAKIQQRLAQQRQEAAVLDQKSSSNWLKVAAVIALVLCSNIWAITTYMSSTNQTPAESGEYSQVTSDFNLYGNE